MANNVLSFPGTTGTTVYVNVEFDGQLWNGTAFEAVANADVALYKIAMTEATGTGWFTVAFPSGIAAAPRYGVVIRQQAGGSPAFSDLVLGAADVSWDGTNLGTVVVDNYASGQDPATLVLATPDQKLATDSSGHVTAASVVGDVGGSVASVTGNVGGNVAGSVNSVVSGVAATLPAIPPQGYGVLSGTGSLIVTQDYGGIGNYSAIDSQGNGIGGSTVTAFLTSDYIVNGRNSTPKAQVVTTASGQWQTAMNLAPATSYTVVFSDRGFLANPVLLVTS